MYTPQHFAQTDEAVLWSFIGQHGFGTLLSVADGRPIVSHLPFLADRDASLLHCHVARGNPHWQAIARSPQVLAIFAGPHGYVSPTWYAEPGGVPTWNYAVAHVHGEAVVLDDAAHTRKHVEALAAKYEHGRAAPWIPEYDPRRLAGIVGIEIRVQRLEGKFKLSQNRSAADRAQVVAQLRATQSAADAALAQLMSAVEPRS